MTLLPRRAPPLPTSSRALCAAISTTSSPRRLKKQAAERYPTAAALAEDLRRYLDHEPVSARADSLAYRASKFVRRYRLAVGAASVTLLALLAGVVGTTWQAWEARTQRDRALAEIRYSRVNHEVLMLFSMTPCARVPAINGGSCWTGRVSSCACAMRMTRCHRPVYS